MPVKPPEPEEVDVAEVEQLIELAEQGRLEADGQKRIVPLLRTLIWLERTLLETRMSLAKLRRLLFGKRTEKPKRKSQEPPSGSEEGGSGDSGQETGEGLPPEGGPAHPPPRGGADAGADTPSEPPADPPSDPAANTPSDPSGDESPTKRPRGHGRLGVADYPGAERIFCAHGALQAGDLCPTCERGRLYPSRPLVRLRFQGQSLGLATCYELEQLRCGGCGALFVAHMPPEAGEETYDTSLKVNLVLAHYHLGLPFKRIELFQTLVGMPLPDATQWDLVEQVADSAYPIYEILKPLAANQARVYQDDTSARILSLIQENQADPPPERQGMYTTVLRFEGEQAICLYFTGRQHAGENLDDILAHRDPELPPIQWMSDGLAANTPKTHPDLTLQINCIVHGRRNFVDIEEFFPEECARVIEAIALIYKHEAHCREQALTPTQRLAYHQQHSRPVMDELKAWMEKQFEDKRVEPNSRLGGAFNYLLKRWKSLTRFLEVPGAPLDNNTAERALKIILRLRKNSLFYKNAHGAYVGDVLISLIETCRLAGANPQHYFTALMENRSAVFRDPGAWLPWNYLDTLRATAQGPPLSHLPPVLGQLDPLGVAVPQ
jgi:transposase